MTSRTITRHARLVAATLAATLAGSTLLVATTATSADAARPHQADAPLQQVDRPLVFGHRGAPGYRPEHTLASYRLAIQLGADYIEPDLVPTKDGVLVARHENDITGTTDVADHPEFADRRTTKTIDGKPITGWFTEDFTLAELKTLRAKERLPQVRPGNTRYDGRFEVPTFAEVLQLVQDEERRTGRTIGVAPETKHPTYFDSIGLSPEEPMLRTLRQFHLDRKRSAVLIQSFEVSNLQQLNRMTDLPLEQLTDATGGPYDSTAAGRPVTYADMVKPAGLARIAAYADWLGPNKDQVLPRDPATGATGAPSPVVADAHRAGLRVVVFTLRDENQFMATNFRRGTDPNAKGDIHAEVTAFLDAGVDALFADYADSAVDARDDWLG
ncbi:glycerophosphodiester phosphodiesterase [Nocardioides sp. KIGAM211]|uniref:glycerophosphodiester phosphodiesterase n=1 Tax=Nocardioides luti TaxID=2761101 RepID=A0A7X0RHI7_9ACTN|nr:glycerophosphodiester phosphodiesterase [Nocardioides luti]MBB6628255.1 glycerophosphodiester phosphodiesterase [Nocardioides luti]